MDSRKITKFTCRICLNAETSTKPLTTICEQTAVDLWTMLLDLTNLNIFANYPVNICNSCEKDLIASYSFKMKCLKNENILKLIRPEDLIEKQQQQHQEMIVADEIPMVKVEHKIETVDSDDDPLLNSSNANLISYPTVDSLNLENTLKSVEIFKIEIDDETNAKSTDEEVESSDDNDYVDPNFQRNTKESSREKYVAKYIDEVMVPVNKLRRVDLKHTQVGLRKPCEFCAKFVNMKYMRIHNKSHNIQQKYCCDMCGKYFSVKLRLRLHMNIHMGIDVSRLRCTFCGRKFESEQDLDAHTPRHRAKMFECNICKRQYAKKYEIRDHIYGIHFQEKCKCALCGKEYNFKSSLSTHMTRKHRHPGNSSPNVDDDNCDCHVCGKHFATPKLLRVHINKHPEVYLEKVHSELAVKNARIKKKSLVDRKSKSNDESTTEPNSNDNPKKCPKVVCTICGKMITNSYFNKHVDMHKYNRTRLHKCTKCDKCYMTKNQLLVHFRSHTNQKPYACKYCGEQFRIFNTRKRHIRMVHKHEKKFECTYCGIEITDLSNLRNHIRRIHSFDLKHECEICGKKFAAPYCLNDHMYTHTGIKTLKCKICPELFGTQKHRRQHVKSVHESNIE